MWVGILCARHVGTSLHMGVLLALVISHSVKELFWFVCGYFKVCLCVCSSCGVSIFRIEAEGCL